MTVYHGVGYTLAANVRVSKGDSYRLREKQKAGLLKKAPMPDNL